MFGDGSWISEVWCSKRIKHVSRVQVHCEGVFYFILPGDSFGCIGRQTPLAKDFGPEYQLYYFLWQKLIRKFSGYQLQLKQTEKMKFAGCFFHSFILSFLLSWIIRWNGTAVRCCKSVLPIHARTQNCFNYFSIVQTYVITGRICIFTSQILPTLPPNTARDTN